VSFWSEEQEALRETCRRFTEREIVPHLAEWEEAQALPRELHVAAAKHGLLGVSFPEEVGGQGGGLLDSVALTESMMEAGASGGVMASLFTHGIALPHIVHSGNQDLIDRFVRPTLAGELIGSLAITEPDGGSDVAGIRTKAQRDGDHYVVDGAKTFITNGLNGDLILVAARTGSSGTHRDISILVVERDAVGFTRGPRMEKLGQHAQDTAELFFQDVRVPAANLLGEEGSGFLHMSRNLAQERLSIALGAVAAADGALTRTLDYVLGRHAFGRPIGTFQNSRFRLAECRTEVEVAQAFVDRCLAAHVDGVLAPAEASMAKLWATEMLGRVTDACLQLHGGYGYMTEYPIARAYADARIGRIYGGTSEIMKELIGRSMGLADPR
jgi:alkylation response protein AidB-like acyl-CoA dehydrogenase